MSLDTEAELGASLKVVPGFAMTDAFPSGWLGCNSALLDECIEALPVDKPFAVRVVLSLEAAPTASARQRVADALGRHHPDLFLLSFAGLNPNASSEQLVRALELAQPFQQIGRCVVCEAGAFAPFWFAFDLGVAVDLVAESPFGSRPHTWATTRFDFPSLLTSLRIEDAKVMLEMSDVPERECPCYACRSSASFAERLSAAVDHNAAMASRERAIAMSMSAAVRQQALSERLGSARASEIAARVGQWEARIARLDAVARALDLADSRLGTLAA